jgi:hypothetical protein
MLKERLARAWDRSLPGSTIKPQTVSLYSISEWKENKIYHRGGAFAGSFEGMRA